MPQHAAGHRVSTRTADLLVRAWAPTRERCIAEALLGAVGSFADSSAAPAPKPRRSTVVGDDEGLLVAALEELVYLLDTAGEVPVTVEVTRTAEGAEISFGMVPVGEVEQVGAVPKAVSLHDLRIAPGPEGWSCSVLLDL
jgi:SHS2 domain-containing protein